MLEVGFQHLRSGRDLSPDSVIFTGESNFSMFSSTSASVERCSFASDPPDPDSVAFAASQNLVGHERHERSEVMGGGPDPGKPTSVNKISVVLSRKEKSKGQKLDTSEPGATEDDNNAIDSARNSFSRALKECQERRLRSEVVLKKTDRPRLASVELQNSSSNAVSSSSPRFGLTQKPSAATQRTGSFPSPGTPAYRNSTVAIQKGWSSERVPLHSNMNRRNVNGALMSCNNGRTLPSKWEDAERWIFSPVSGEGPVRNSFQQSQRRPKSKSGPLGPPGVAYYQMFSPAVTSFERGNFAKMAGDSPVSTGLISTDPSSTRYRISQDGGNFILATNPCMARSMSIHGCAEMVNQSAFPAHEGPNQDGKYNCIDGASANNASMGISRRDMATQMSPENSSNSSPERISSFSIATPSVLPLVELHASQQELRNMTIEERVSMSRWSKKSWIISAGVSKSISKAQREEARITAWENLQKAKAEASIRKLEMKLEKKRSTSMEKIMNKLRGAQLKAQNMRSSVMANQAMHQTSDRTTWPRRTLCSGFFSRYFICHAS